MTILNRFIATVTLALIGLSSHAVEVGEIAPATPVNILEGTASGQAASIADYKGQLVYLDFWASWCGPCRVSLPILNEIRKEYASKGFEVVAVNVDENLDDALKFLNKYPVDYPILLDPKGQMPKAYQIPGMPTAFLLDREGTVIYKHVGFKKKDREKIISLIEKNL